MLKPRPILADWCHDVEPRIAAAGAGDIFIDSKWQPLLSAIALAAVLVVSALTSVAAQDAATKARTYEPRLRMIDFSAGSPLFIRIFKQEAQLELWMQKAGRFELLDSFPICHWSGTSGGILALLHVAQLNWVRLSAHATATFKSLHLPPAPATNGKSFGVRLVVLTGVIIRPRIVQLAWCG
jgi:hypothetical protein